MIIKHATQVGNPVIRRKSRVVARPLAPATRKIVENLMDSMRYHGLVGMAAPQIGINERIFVTEIAEAQTSDPDEEDRARAFINPKLVSRSRAQKLGYEGCGSVAEAGLFGNVARSTEIVIEAIDEKGKKFRLRAKGLLARIIQHENDHLEGMIFLDRLPDMKSLISREELLLTGFNERKRKGRSVSRVSKKLG